MSSHDRKYSETSVHAKSNAPISFGGYLKSRLIRAKAFIGGVGWAVKKDFAHFRPSQGLARGQELI